MLQPPSMSSPLIILSADVLSIWCSTSVSVWAGATTMLSPVWYPIGSKFSMLQTMMQLSEESLMTSYSNSFHPKTPSSTRTCLILE